ncbi:MAG: COX15/CtaA family protein [Acidimicrobiia bacterium]|nr:COX15/CtaA family protein [Acidimicrobiia bacterium]
MYRRITLGVLVTQVVIVLTGAAVRLTGSGLGCSDWPRCEQDRFVPSGDLNPIIEFVNRLVSFPVLVAVLLAVWGARHRVPVRRDLGIVAELILAGVVVQVLLGAVVVRLELLPSTVILHFLISMALLFGSVVLHHRAGADLHAPSSGPAGWVPARSRPLVIPLVALATAVVVTGTVVTGAGPHGGDEHAARLDVFLPTAARVHSLTVWTFLAVLVVVLLALRSERAPAPLLRTGTIVLAVSLAQGAVGYLQYWNGVPAGLVFAHIIGAMAVWGTTVWFWLEHRSAAGIAAAAAPPTTGTPSPTSDATSPTAHEGAPT